MLLYSKRTAVFKNGEKSVLLCRIILPTDAKEVELDTSIAEFYARIYEATYSFAKGYAARISPPDGRIATLSVKCADGLKRGRIIIKRTYTLSYANKVVSEKTFVDKFKLKCDKTKKYSVKER